MKDIITLSQFDSLAACSSKAIKELAESLTPNSDTIVITASTKEPDKNSYWFYIEEVEE